MGKLVTQSIKTLFGGVSRQPQTVRRDNQVEVADNALPSIVTGGVEKRPCSQHLAKLVGLENRLQSSEDLTAVWATSGTIAVTASAAGGTAPLGLPYFQINDTDAAAPAYVTQTVTTTDTGYFILSAYVRDRTAGKCRLVMYSFAGYDAAVDIDFSTNEVTPSGTMAVLAGAEEFGDWVRIWVIGDVPTPNTQLICRLYVSDTATDTGSYFATGLQLEKALDEDQQLPSPYCYTGAFTWPREDAPGTGDEEVYVHPIDRSATEQYVALLSSSGVRVYDAMTGEAHQVVVGDTTRYFMVDGDASSTASEVITPIHYAPYEDAVDYTIWWYGATGTTTLKIYHTTDGETWDEVHSQAISTASGSATTTETLAAGTIKVKVAVTTAGTAGTIAVAGAYRDTGYMSYASPAPEDFSAVSVADHTFIVNRLVPVALGRSGHPTGAPAVLGTYQTFSAVPAAASGNVGKLAHVVGNATDGFLDYWLISAREGTTYVWNETVSPSSHNVLDAATMPLELTRLSSGRFVLAGAPWAAREAGDEKSNPAPSFVDQTISNMFFFKGRLGVLSNESIVLSRIDTVYSWFAEKAVDTLDTDPIDRTASTEKISLLQWAVPFRNLLFVTADTMQFELSSNGVLTSESAALDPSTAYAASTICRPSLMGDALYFASTRPGGSTIFEYYFDQDSLSNRAEAVTSHIGDYVPAGILGMRSDPTSGTLFCTCSEEPGSVFVYRTFYSNEQKVMSSWCRYTFGDAFIHGLAVFGGYMVMVIERAGGTFLEQLAVDTEPPAEGYYAPLLDRRTVVTGVYDDLSDTTTFTLPYAHNDQALLVLGSEWTGQRGRILTASYEGTNDLVVFGDFSADPIYAGIPYTMTCTLSDIFLRDADGAAITTGKLMLKEVVFAHTNTGYYKVAVTPLFRDTNYKEFTGLVVGDRATEIGDQPILSGTLRVPAASDATKISISITNPSPLPCTITSLEWRGFYMDIGRAS